MTLTTTTSSSAEANPFHDLTPALVDAVRQFDAAANTDQETAVRDSIVNAAQAIIDAARPPQPQWMNQSAACAEFVALRLFIEWGAFEAIPLEGTISYQALAEKIDADMQLVRTSTPLHTILPVPDVCRPLCLDHGQHRPPHPSRHRRRLPHG